MKVNKIVSHLMSSVACVALVVFATQHPDQIEQLTIGAIGGILISVGVTQFTKSTPDCKPDC